MSISKLGRLLIVDDEVELMTVLCNMLRKQGYEAVGFASGKEALGALSEREFDLLLADLMMPEMNGVALLKAGMEIDPHLTGIIMTGHGTVPTAVEAMKVGAFDYVLKPFKLNAMLPILARAMDVRRLRLENVQLRETMAIYELSKAIAFTLDSNTILHKVADAALQQCEADEVSIMLPTGENDGLYVAVVRGEQREHLLGERLPMEQGIAGWVARHHQMLTLEGEINDLRFAPVRPRPDIRSAVSMPMLVGNHLVGVLNVNATRRRQPLTLGQIKALTILAGMAAPALEAARLYEQVRQSEEHYRLVLEHVDEIVYQVDTSRDDPVRGIVRFVSRRVENILGYTFEEFLNDPGLWARLIHPDDMLTLEAQTRAIYASHQAGTREYRLQHKATGEYRWLEDRVLPQFDESGRMIGIFGVARDVSERKGAEERYKKLALVVEQTADTVFICNREGKIEYVNSAFEALTGYTREELVGRTPRLLKSGEHPPGFYVVLWKTILAGKVFRATFANRKKNGELYYEEKTITPLKDDRGNITHFVSTGKDITERIRAEAALRESEEKYRDLVNEVNDGFYVTDDKGMLTFANQALARIHGFESPEQIMGRRFAEFLSPSMADDFVERYRRALETGTSSELAVAEIVRPDGTSAVVEIKPVLMFKENAVVGNRGVVRDITERTQQEREREAIVAMASALRIARTRAEMLPIILDQMLNLLQADGAALAMRDPASGETVIEMARGELAAGIQLRLPPGEGVSGYVILSGQAYVTNDIRAEPRFMRPDLLERIRAVACLPLIAQEQAIGALWVGRASTITTAEVRLLTAIADMVANAIHRATLYEQTERSLQRLTALRTIDAAITSSLDLRLTLKVLLDQVTAQLQVDAADVLLFDPHIQLLEYAAGRGFRTNSIARSRLRLEEGHAGRAVLERRLVSIPDLSETGTAFVRAGLLADEGFRVYYGAPLIAKGSVKGVLEIFHRVPLTPDPEWLDFLETVAGQTAIAIDDAELFVNLQRSNVELALAYDATIEGWSRALDLRDKETEGHTQRVTEMTERLARAMGIGDAELVHIRRGALLHDIGKMGVPDGILLKPGKLTDEEWIVMRRHPQLAYEMLLPITYLKPALVIPYCHHEKWDGTGYPHSLKGEQIPLAARIFAVVDVWDALRSDRPYRLGWSDEKVRDHIREQAGKHFDPEVVEVFLAVLGASEAG